SGRSRRSWTPRRERPPPRSRPAGARAPPPRAASRAPDSPEILLLEDVQVLDEVVERHLGVDLAAMGREWAHERGVALTPHREGGDVAVLLDLGQEAFLPPPVGIGQDLAATPEVLAERLLRLLELGLHAARVLGLGLALGAAQVGVGLGVGLDVEAGRGHLTQVVPGERPAARADPVGIDE